jgi:hypothetical protein
MNTKKKAMSDIEEFILSDKKCMLITGTHQFKKHVLVMAMIEKLYKNAKVLFRASGVEHTFTTPNILGQFINKKYKAGDLFRIGNNIYSVDSYTRGDTWNKTANVFDFAIVYSIDGITANTKLIESIDNLFNNKRINKIFLVSWTDHKNDDMTIYNKFVDSKTIYDVEEEDIHYHRRVLGLED